LVLGHDLEVVLALAHCDVELEIGSESLGGDRTKVLCVIPSAVDVRAPGSSDSVAFNSSFGQAGLWQEGAKRDTDREGEIECETECEVDCGGGDTSTV
jgi:hypothetical protein